MLDRYREAWCLDFEFIPTQGDLPRPVCLIASEHHSGRRIELWFEDSVQVECPFAVDRGVLFIAHMASAEIQCFLALGWPVPSQIICTYAEFKVLTNSDRGASGGLLAAARHFNIQAMAGAEKDTMRDLIISGGPWSEEERLAIAGYCAEDVRITWLIFHRLAESLDRDEFRWPHALIRGEYQAATARMYAHGLPFDNSLYSRIRENWDSLKLALIERTDCDYHVYRDGSFNARAFREYVERENLAWPMLPSGQLCLDEQTFSDMAKRYPQVADLHELRKTLSKLRELNIPIGLDGRVRADIRTYWTKTGRNMTSPSEFLFAMPKWLRWSLKPAAGHGVAYLDWSGQELAIAACHSGDEKLWAAYESGDPYMAFALEAYPSLPRDATKHTHPTERERAKIVCLGTQYGMTHRGIAHALGIPIEEAYRLLRQHQRSYPEFWAFVDGVVQTIAIGRRASTFFGWEIGLRYEPGREPGFNQRSLMNWNMQSSGADMLRLGVSLALERGVKVIAPVHDAILIEYQLGERDQSIAAATEAMVEASRLVLNRNDRVCRVDVDVVDFPDRFVGEPRKPGDTRPTMFESILELLEELEGDPKHHPG